MAEESFDPTCTKDVLDLARELGCTSVTIYSIGTRSFGTNDWVWSYYRGGAQYAELIRGTEQDCAKRLFSHLLDRIGGGV